MKPQQAATIESACEKFGLTLGMIGESLSGISENPEDRLLQYDIVFAKGRCAREAFAIGNCVIACDAQGMGPMVTANNLAEMNGRNFGRRVLLNEINEPSIWEQLQKYNAEDACQVTDTI
ncbi:MAG: hypothetical protein COA78_16675 [Blastopirellula sp.]|nr:MAG: hypothetical protein COA78_16675 [Blastopirellula sp.]